MIVEARKFSSGSECIAHAAQLRAKFFKPNVKPVAKVAAGPTAVPVEIKPLWMFGDLRFDRHVHAYHSHIASETMIGAHRIKRYIRDRAAELGLTYAIVIGRSRTREVVAARHLITWEIKNSVKPEISYPELGRLMGGRDHTSILHSIRKIAALKAEDAA